MSYEEEDTCHMRRRTHGIWVDGLLSKVPLHPGIVIRGALILRKLPALTKQVSKETYYRGKRDLCADFESLPADHACSLGGKGNDIELRRRREVEKLRMDQDGNLATH